MLALLRFARDGANYTARAVYDCYYNSEDTDYVVIDYYPERYKDRASWVKQKNGRKGMFLSLSIIFKFLLSDMFFLQKNLLAI